MQILRKILLVLIFLLGLGAGASKVLLMPEEIEFFSKVRLTNTMVILFGVIQLLGTFLIVFSKTQKIGLYALGLTFATSTIILLLVGKISFGLFSILPIASILLVLKINSR